MKRKVLFIINDLTIFEHAGIMQLSGCAKAAGHETALGVAETDDLPAKVREWRPDVVAFSVLTGEQRYYLGVCRRLKAEVDCFALFGGLHPTLCPDEFMREECVDAVCLGEGDLAFPEFLDKFGTDALYGVKNFWFKTPGGEVRNPMRPLVDDLDALPWFDRDILYSRSSLLRDQPIKRFALERGCLYTCGYCFNQGFHELYGLRRPYVRSRSADDLIAEMKAVRSKYPMSFIRFDDNLFSMGPDLLEQFAERYRREIGLPFNCPLHPSMVTEQRAQLLKRAGCVSVLIGVECGVRRIREKALNRHMSDEQIERACHIMRDAGIRVCTSNMIGLPDETIEDSFATMHLNQRCDVAYAWCTLFQPYPGTALGKYCEEKGYFTGDYSSLDSFFTRSRLEFSDPEAKSQFENLHRLFAIGVSFPRLEPVIRRLIKLPSTTATDWCLALIYKLWYGYALKMRVYPFNIKLGLGLRAFLSYFRVRKAVK